jgi:uncharacterized membrane protein YhaH (DUF805 family)
MGSIFGIKGRYNRLQWWMTQLAMTVLLTLAFFLFAKSVPLQPDANKLPDISGSAIASLFVVFAITFWLNLSASIKRYHDRGKSGWWFLIMMVPLIGPIWQLAELGFLSGDNGYNQFDEDDRFEPSPSVAQRPTQSTADFQPLSPAPHKKAEAAAGQPSFGQKPSFGRRV